MRVEGNVIPEPIHIEPYPRHPGMVEIRLRENVQQITKTDDITGQEYTMYAYDEYVFQLVDTPGLRETIEANLPHYLATYHELEYNRQASEVADLLGAMAELRLTK